ncbi:MAG: hypothetical protein ABR928_05190 [Terracidiphilus sp.]|jgi:hypothetical protein
MARRKPRRETEPAQENECVEFTNRISLPVNEKGVSATFRNPRRNELRKIKYDKCYFKTIEGGRADYIIGYDREIDVILELKGSDLKHAMIQVSDTLERWRNDLLHYEQIVCLIVFGHTFPRMTSRLGVLELEFLEKHSTLLWIRQSGAEKFSFRNLAGKKP